MKRVLNFCTRNKRKADMAKLTWGPPKLDFEEMIRGGVIPSFSLVGTPPAVPAVTAPPPEQMAEPAHVPAASAWEILVRHAEILPRVLLYGPKGTGKTHLAMFGGTGDTPGRRVNCTEDTPSAELRGHWVPQGGNGAWAWHDGPVMDRFRNGGRVVIDEIGRARDDAFSFLLGVLDGHAVTLPNGETVLPHPSFSAWATTNGTPDELPEALADRFEVKVECSSAPGAMLKLLPEKFAGPVSDLDSGITFRLASRFVWLTEEKNVPREEAATLIWGDRAQDVLYALDLEAAA